MPQDFRLILETRINNPTLSLEEVGSIIGMSKDSVAGKLRRVQVAIESGKTLKW
jgi:DNA-binding transcriptional regulator WhiA